MIRHNEEVLKILSVKPKLEPAVLESGILHMKIKIFIRFFGQKRLKNVGIPAVVRHHLDKHLYTL
jgi:hypothetical protein